MATEWSTLHNATPRTWLLSNGEVITEPALEVSGSRRRVRIRYASQSHPMADKSKLLMDTATSVARRKKTTVLLELTKDLSRQRDIDLGWKLEENPSAILHLVHTPKQRASSTKCWWTFRHPTMPQVEATIAVDLTGSRTDLTQTLRASLHLPFRDHDGTTDTFLVKTYEPTFPEVAQKLAMQAFALKDRWTDWMRADPPKWPMHHLTPTHVLASPRSGVRALLEVVRAFDDIDTIQVPDGRDPQKPGWMNLELAATNVTGQFVSDMREYLDGNPVMEQALGHYRALLKVLRSVGVDVRMNSDKVDNDFTSAMLAGETGVLLLRVHNPIGDDGGLSVDGEHSLDIHLPTGSMVVQCTHKAPTTPTTDPELIAQKWEESKLIARMTGQEDELLAYARAYAEQQQTRRLNDAIKERS